VWSGRNPCRKAWPTTSVCGDALVPALREAQRLAAYGAEALGGPAAYSEILGDETAVVRLHSGNGEHDEMDARAIECLDRALEDAGLAGDQRLRAALHAY